MVPRVYAAYHLFVLLHCLNSKLTFLRMVPQRPVFVKSLYIVVIVVSSQRTDASGRWSGALSGTAGRIAQILLSGRRMSISTPRPSVETIRNVVPDEAVDSAGHSDGPYR